ncbi:DUF3817 domain-containing protein [Tessaracoccus sp. OS52]|uniref:DUF3817 domain-containing protein n=1 Tax=Tessaracoccus sp. OS52 TaxID=2886691 RepID=UPI001D114744|nr:DUF3817 domain-containing protein [Tessaracoccus sp. OS52]MCC2593823.1 DUF3817 domain-containing protein [Tessaracoccus sp. OS52]
MADAGTEPAPTEFEGIEVDEIPGIRGALLRYRIMAWVVGILLVVLVCLGALPKWFGPTEAIRAFGTTMVTFTGVPHGWLYMVLLITAYDLSRRVGWSIKWVLAIMAAGTVPFLSFVAEHYATKDVREKLTQVAELES